MLLDFLVDKVLLFVGQLFSVRLMAQLLHLTNTLLVGLTQKPTSILLLICKMKCLKVKSLRILRDIGSKITLPRPFTLMVDETTDADRKDQCVVVICWVDNGLQAHEEFIGMYVTASTDANSIVAIIKDALMHMNLSLAQCHGQCYDGATVMQGCRNGVCSCKKIASKALGTLHSLLRPFFKFSLPRCNKGH